MTNGNALLIFRQLLVANGTAFSKISKKRTTSRGILEFVGWFREISAPCAAVSKFSKVLVKWKAPTNYLRKFLSFGPSFSLWRTTLQTEKTVEVRAQDNYGLRTSFSNIKVHPKNSNHAQAFELTGAPLTRARSPHKLSCKSENGVGDKGDTFKGSQDSCKNPIHA